MNSGAILFFLCLIICILLGIILYQQWAFRTGTQRKLREIHKKLEEIIAADSSESRIKATGGTNQQHIGASPESKSRLPPFRDGFQKNALQHFS